MRLDRIATLYLTEPFTNLLAPSNQARVPMLMYHAVQQGISDSRPYYETNVSPEAFANQIRALRNEGYRSATLEEALRSLQNQSNEKLVVITFDDGYDSIYEEAFPILVECGFTATVFLMTGYMANDSIRFKNKKCLSWNQVRELQAHGVRFGSHTVTHPQLQTLSRDRIKEELQRSKATIEDAIGALVCSFSYPYAFPETDKQFRSFLRQALVESGYQNGVTTILGTAHRDSDPMFLPRLPVNRWDDSRLFRAKFSGAYDWLHAFQYAAKWMHPKVN